MTRDEMKSIEKAMKDPEFRDMLGDYMEEISEPANKEEADKYLLQLQRDRELPKGMILVQPKAAFCITSEIASHKEHKFEQKMYINICHHDCVEKSEIVDVVENGKKGKSWRLPHILSKIRYNQDKEFNEETKKDDIKVVNVIDICFHPEAIMKASQHPQYQKIMCESA